MLSASRLNLLASIQALPRDLRLLFLSLFLWTFGLGLYNYIWPLYLRDLQASPSDVGLVFSIGFLALAVSMIPGGILANKYELKALLIIGWAMSIPPPLMYYFARTWTDVIPGIVLFQVSGFNVPAFNAYIAGAADGAKSASNLGVTWASAPLGVVFSPLVGSVLLNWIPVRSIFILTFVFFSISTIVLFLMKPPSISSRSGACLECSIAIHTPLLPRRAKHRLRSYYFSVPCSLWVPLSSPFSSGGERTRKAKAGPWLWVFSYLQQVL